MADLNAALIGLLGVLAGGYFNNFLAEDYKRFRDGQALAGALAGELEAHSDAFPYMKDHISFVIDRVKMGDDMESPEWQAPTSPIFEANTAKIGLLRPSDAKNVAHAYEQIRSFREKLRVIAKSHKSEELSRKWRLETLGLAGDEIVKAGKIVDPLIDSLNSYSHVTYWSLPETRKKLIHGLVIGGAFLLALKFLG
jgi:hypothetical protein